eukprot:1644498-Rhodomonas_salina.1
MSFFDWPQAFTDPAEPSTGQLNSALVMILVLGLLSIVQGGSDRSWAEEQTHAMSEKVISLHLALAAAALKHNEQPDHSTSLL